MEQRKIRRVVNTQPRPGFLGEGHTAAAVLEAEDFSATDPFIFLMDDRLDFQDSTPRGGPHPHAGFETVTLVLQGDDKYWKTGSLELMTAGSGIVHTESITGPTQLQILQLWITLPPEKRWTQPRWQELLLDDVPAIKTGKQEIRVYSGTSAGLTSPLQNHTPFTLVDFRLGAHTRFIQELPASYHGFIYVLEGSVKVGDVTIRAEQAGWLTDATGELSQLQLQAGEETARFILYAGEPQGVPIVQHGPFVGDTTDDITRLYREYRMGMMKHLNELEEEFKVRHGRVLGSGVRDRQRLL